MTDTRTEIVRYGQDVPAESELHLLGHLEGRRVLELGCGARSSAVPMAKQGAHVIAVDPHPERIAFSQGLAEDEEVKVEWHDGDLADLAFLRADSVDLAFSVGALIEVEDLGRLLRQVHRVLSPGSSFVFAYDHPATLAGRGRGYYDETPLSARIDGVEVTQYPRTISDVFLGLVRSGYRVEYLGEPRPASSPSQPATIIWRAKKEGV